VLFLSGMDWEQLESSERERSSRPVINLVQSLWHACPDDPFGRYQSLSHKAIRISVSPEVTDAVIATGRVNGPIYTIPAAIDFDNVIAHTRPNSERDTDIAIFGKKEPELARRLAARLGRPGRGVQLIDRQVSRADALDWMSRSNVTVMLARRKEGNPLPPLEGMALGTIVVSPDCIGNRAYCLPGVNCFRPDYDEDSIVQAAESAVHELPHLGEMIENAARTARQRDLSGEREAFLEILRSVDELWAGI
jgi:glycosyltransferase involved in cell wall biosynthesis